MLINYGMQKADESLIKIYVKGQYGTLEFICEGRSCGMAP
jgi:hypothetical protein